MSKKLKPATRDQVRDVELALGHLRRAKVLLKRADCPKAVETLGPAIKSTEGAVRHANRRAMLREQLGNVNVVTAGPVQA